MLARGLAYTLRIDGRLIACAGVIEISPTQGHLWSFLSVHAPRHMVRLHKIARRFLEVSGKRQLVATTEIDFPDGSRWLEMLGFLKVGCLDHYGPDGRDHHLYILER